jgi:site-specific recombinase XerD
MFPGLNYKKQIEVADRLLAAPSRPAKRSGAKQRLAVAAAFRLLKSYGYALANKGHDTRALQAYLGHKNIQHTVRYTELAPTRFKDFWR